MVAGLEKQEQQNIEPAMAVVNDNSVHEEVPDYSEDEDQMLA